jgi:hypothetical protein
MAMNSGEMPQARRGMPLEELRQVWQLNAKAKEKEIMDRYYAQRRSDGGREGLAIWERYARRVRREKILLAAKLLRKAGFEVSYATIGHITGQARRTIAGYWSPPEPKRNQTAPVQHNPKPVVEPESEPPANYRFPGPW